MRGDAPPRAVEWGGRTRDPAVAPDGKVWFVGQAGNYIAHLDPKTEQFKRYEIEEGTNPHTHHRRSAGHRLVAGNRNGRIGRLDPDRRRDQGDHDRRGEGSAHAGVRRQGQHLVHVAGSNRVGRLNMTTEKVDLITPNETPSNPYGIVID